MYVRVSLCFLTNTNQSVDIYGKMKYNEEAKRAEETPTPTPTSTQRNDEMGKLSSSEDNDDEEK